MGISSSSAIFLISLLGIPVALVVNKVSTLHGELGLFLSGAGSLSLVCCLVYLSVRNSSEAVHPFLFALILGTFSSVVDFILVLENENIVSGFLSEYLKDGEPYLSTPHGSLICAWDGVGHYIMYMFMLTAMAYKQDFRRVGLYWVGSIGHSMIVFLIGNVVGKFGIRWSFLLNIPYIIIAYASGAWFLSKRPSLKPATYKAQTQTSLFTKLMDLLCITGLLFSLMISLYRGLVVLAGQGQPHFYWYIQYVEPYLEDPVAYPKMQMLTYLFYFVPYYVLTAYGLLYPPCDWLSDWALIHAGAAAQAQISHIGSSIHPRTQDIFQLPSAGHGREIFWGVNLFLLIFPHMLAYRCVQTENNLKAKSHKNQ